MALENRIFKKVHNFTENDILYHRESFGWDLVSGTDEKMFFKRETTIRDYRSLKKLEGDYENKLSLYIKYDKKFKINYKALLILLILTLGVGALIYLIILLSMNLYYKSQAKKYLKEMKSIIEEARKLRYFKAPSGMLEHY